MDVLMENEIADMESLPRSAERSPFGDAVDLSVLLSFEDEHVDGQPDLVVELIDLYLDDVPRKLKLMRDALKVSDVHRIRGTAHGLKGSSSSLGAGQMAARCDELEADATSLTSNGLESLLDGIEQEFELVQIAFTAERLKRLTEVRNP